MSSVILTIATEWGGASNKTGKTEVPRHYKVGHDKNPYLLYRPKLCSPSPVVVMRPLEWRKKNRAGRYTIYNCTTKEEKQFFYRIFFYEKKKQSELYMDISIRNFTEIWVTLTAYHQFFISLDK